MTLSYQDGRLLASYVKYDQDFDGYYFIEMIVHKLHIMLDYYEHGKYCMQIDESRLEIVDSLKEACRLGDMIIKDEFEEEAYEIMLLHHRMWTEPNPEPKSGGTIKMEWDSLENEALYRKASEAGQKHREEIVDEFFDYIKKNYRSWWD